MNDEILRKAYPNLKMAFQLSCDENKKLRLSSRIAWLIIVSHLIYLLIWGY